MRPALKMNEIDQQHLQELFNAAGVARDDLPYSPQFDALCEGFQDRTFKNAHAEQIFSALLKHARTSAAAPMGTPTAPTLPVEQLKMIKTALTKHGKAGKVVPYSDEFEGARKDFNKLTNSNLNEREFWEAVVAANGAKRRPPPPRKKVAAKVDEDEE